MSAYTYERRCTLISLAQEEVEGRSRTVIFAKIPRTYGKKESERESGWGVVGIEREKEVREG